MEVLWSNLGVLILQSIMLGLQIKRIRLAVQPQKHLKNARYHHPLHVHEWSCTNIQEGFNHLFSLLELAIQKRSTRKITKVSLLGIIIKSAISYPLKK